MANSIQLTQIGNVSLNGAEISDFDPKSKRLFVTGELEGKAIIQVIDASNPNNPTKITNIDLSSLGGGIQSVAVRKGIGTENSIFAVAISANNSTDFGKVAFYDAVTLTKLSEVIVGSLPDMITFTPDGSKLLVANEGEPNEDYTVDPEGSVSIIDVSGDIASLDNSKVTTADFTAFNGQEATLKAEGVRIFGLNASASEDFEPEYIAVSPDNQTAFITLQENNAVAILDIASGTITDVVPLGFKDHSLPGNGLDASDRDDGIKIENRPVLGMYLPDAISSFQVGDETFYITANEGDARIRPTGDDILPAPNDGEGDIFNEEVRVKDVILDPTAFPNAAELQKDENLGRLLITNTLGDIDGDGDFDQLYAYGARSFSIWNSQGQLVYDSGDQIERILSQQTPAFFNANNGSADDVDTRSDNKGPEPESVVVGVIDDVPYGFVGLERAGGGVMVYNLSDPTAPEFVQYIRTEGDISPEGLKFISAEDSPNTKPMLAVANEVSNTVSFYEILLSAAPTVETSPDLFDDEDPGQAEVDQNADADDPAIYVNAENSANSLVLTAVKNAGVRVYNLSGNLLQTVNPGEIRYNNIDLQYGFKLGGESIDIAVASDRGNDKLVIFKINPNSSNGNYLEDITDSNIGTIFQAAPFDPPYEPSSRSSYGLTIYRSPFTNDYYVFTGRRETGDIAQLKLIDIGNGKIGAEIVREFTVPTINGIDPQTEGMVVDQETGFLYIGQENVGIWKFDAEPNGSNTGKLIDVVKSLGGSNLVEDVEGLTIYYGANGTGYLIASSQGDNTFAAYTREGNNEFLGRFGIGNNGAIDSVQESDGADVINVPLGANFPYGLFVTQDGNNDPVKLVEDDGEIENVNSNFKFVPWENIANTLPDILKIDTTSYDPRNPVLQPRLTNYEFDNLPKLGTTSAGQDIFLGGFSGLYFQGVAANGNWKFVTHTDRGPNGEPTGQNRPFLLPDFQPEIVSFELNQTTGEISITKRTGLFRADGTTPLTGLPNLQAGAGGTAYTDEIGVDLNGQVLPNDPFGADLEGIVIAENGDYWMVDEYRPAIYHFDVNGKLLERFIPQGTATATEPDQPAGTFGTEVLPAVYAQRRNNRGFEAVALEGNKLYAFIQSAIDNPDNAGDTTSRGSRNLRILEFNIVTKQVTGEYLYLLDDITGSGTAKTDKIGDAVSLGNGKFAVVERDDRSDNTSNKLIYKIDLAAATNINNPANFTLPAGKTIEELSPAELTAAGITSVSKSLIANAAQLGYTGVEKLEGLALVAPNTLALINDNDFNAAGTTTPEKLAILELPDNLQLTLGTAGNDELYAQQGEEIQGLGGNDRLFAEGILGGNILDGGDGDDELFVVEGINNTLKGAAGNDELVVVEGTNNTLDGGAGDDELVVIEGSNNTLRGGIGSDLLRTSSTTGNNSLYGGDNDDTLFGSLASDRLFGESGDDSLFAGSKGTQMTGGAGLDRFFLGNGAVPEAPGEVLDFTKGADKVVVAGIPEVQEFADLILQQTGADTIVKATINGSIRELGILRNVQANTLTAADFDFVAPTNNAPTVTNISKSGAEDTNITFPVENFISAFTDIDSDSLTKIKISSLPANGTLKLDGTAVTVNQEIAVADIAKLVFTPTANFNGNTSFGWNGFDGTVYATTNATVNLVVTPVNDAPTVTNISKSGAEDTNITFTLENFTSAFTDIDSDSLTKIKISSLPANGTLKLDGTAVTVNQEIAVADIAKLVFTPTANFNGNTSFGWNGFDGTVYATTNATVNLVVTPVNDAPTVTNISKSGAEDTNITFTLENFTSAFTDIDSDSLTKIKISSLPANGTLKLDGTAVTVNQEIAVADIAKLVFTPTANFNGNTSFGWNGFDGTVYATTNATVNLVVTPVNDAPTVTNISKSGAEDTNITFTLENFTSAFTDIDSDSLTKIKISSLPANGTLKLDGTAVTVNQEIAVADIAKLVFTPTANFNGNTSFGWNGFDGTVYATTNATVNLVVTPVNDAPTVTNISKSGAEDTNITFTLENFTSAFTDIDSDSLTKIKISSLPANGTLKLDGTAVTVNQEIAVADIAKLVFTPTANFNGNTSFGWNGFDGTVYATTNATVNLVVTPVNDAPTVTNISKSGAEDTNITFTLENFTSAFTDIDSDSLTKIKISSLPANGTLKLDGTAVTVNQEIVVADIAKLVFTPTANFNGNT
ncbi:phytase, partial [Trichormus sp. NMC-1]|uniref:phytase n=1 Tax=Trichormus sp. NMC-1 TaxID=1853259 RepID=UPI001F0269FB